MESAQPDSVTGDQIFRTCWPEDAPEDMLKRTYKRRCDDCGKKFPTRDLHLHIRRREGYKPSPRVLCPMCAERRGDVRDMPMNKKTAPRQRTRIETTRERLPVLLRDPRIQVASQILMAQAKKEIDEAARKKG